MKEERTARGVSMRQMARQLDLANHSFLSRIEAGKETPPIRIVEGYERVLALPPTTLSGLMRASSSTAWTRTHDSSLRESPRRRSKKLLRFDEHDTLIVLSSEARRVHAIVEMRFTALADGVDFMPVLQKNIDNVDINDVQVFAGGKLAIYRPDEERIYQVGVRWDPPLRKGESHQIIAVLEGDDDSNGMMYQSSSYAAESCPLRFRVFAREPFDRVDVRRINGVIPYFDTSFGKHTRLELAPAGFASTQFTRRKSDLSYGVAWRYNE
jgi:transcriptional regulator with XRE-family HTH domain